MTDQALDNEIVRRDVGRYTAEELEKRSEFLRLYLELSSEGKRQFMTNLRLLALRGRLEGWGWDLE